MHSQRQNNEENKMANEMINEIETTEETEAPLTVEVPSGIRAGVVSVPAATSCSSWSACYRIRSVAAVAE
jgi:hypothetical protein